MTDEVEETVESLKASGQPHGSRRVSSLLETKYSKITGYEASLSSMWSGSKYYLALYEVYTDIRLVAAPPVSIAAFGGDIDNWEWPQQKCDFAMYRIYSGPDGKPAPHSDANVPMKPLRHLTISTQGVKPGDFTMIMGYPGRTARYSSSAKVNYRSHVTLPVSNKVRSDQMAIIKGWMDKDPDIRLKYSDKYFSLSNVQENDEGFVQNVGRFGASKHIRREERRMLRDEKALLRELEEKYAEVSDAQKSLTYYRETMIRGTGLGLVATRLRTSRRPLDMDKEYSKLDLRVEKDLFRYCLQSYFDNVNPKYFGEYQEELLSRFGKDYDAMFNALWIDRHMTKDDGIYKFFADVNVSDFNKDIDSIMGERSLTALDKEYTQAKYRARKRRHIEQYPDANSTMRLTYGKVSSFKRDGKMLPWQTFSSEILAKENPDSYDFHLLPEWKNLLAEAQDKGLDLPVNFLTDNDITGGNSGSPVLNARGEIVGLAFDGNKESLASDVYWTPGYNKCVNVDIRFVLWTLENYAHCDNILAEIGQK